MAEQVAAWNKQYSLLYDSYKKTTSDWLKLAFTGCGRSW